MKKLIIGLLALGATHFANAQSCCSKPSATGMAVFASNKQFKDAHELPAKINYSTETGKWIEFSTPDGGKSKAFAFMGPTKSDNYLFVVHEWWGLNDNVKNEAEKWFNTLKNTNVICLDLYDGKVATTKDEASQYMQANDPKRSTAIIQGLIKHVGPSAKIATIGWCFGGGWSLQAALAAGTQTKACVVFYGMPEKNVDRLKTLNSDVLGIFGEQDQWINKTMIEEFDKNMKAAGKTLTQKWYKADHAFANPSNPKFDSSASSDAFVMVSKYLKERLGL